MIVVHIEGIIVMSTTPDNTLIITYIDDVVKLKNNYYRYLYTISNRPNRRGAILKTEYKKRIGLRSRRVANGPLFNNTSLTEAPRTGKSMCKVGLKYRGAERAYTVSVTWTKDHRGNYRRYITASDFQALPQVLKDVAIAKGVNVKGDVIFSRCVAAWAGHNVKGMHVHHVNMDTTDDRLGNLWVLTVAEHRTVHGDKNNLFWDKDWYEYTSTDVISLTMLFPITAEDCAEPIITYAMPDPSQYFVDEIMEMGIDDLEGTIDGVMGGALSTS